MCAMESTVRRFHLTWLHAIKLWYQRSYYTTNPSISGTARTVPSASMVITQQVKYASLLMLWAQCKMNKRSFLQHSSITPDRYSNTYGNHKCYNPASLQYFGDFMMVVSSATHWL